MDITKHRMHSYKTKGEVNNRPTDYNKIDRQNKGKNSGSCQSLDC